MLDTSIQKHWLDAFVRLFDLCRPAREENVVILVESHSRSVNLVLAELALRQLDVSFETLRVDSKPAHARPIIRSTGASNALAGETAAVARLVVADLVIDLTVEGLMHSVQTPGILAAGTRIMSISNEHPDILARLAPDPDLKPIVKDAVARCRSATEMQVTSAAGTNLSVALTNTVTVGVWGWTDRAGTLAHWPGGLVVSYPNAATANGRLVFKPGDINLTFKRYFESEVICQIQDDFITSIEGNSSDARLMRHYLDGFDDALAYATSHVGWGLNPVARYEALCMYDRDDLNGTELRALAGNFLYSTGANEFAGRFTEGHFDLPMMDCTIRLDGAVAVDDGRPV